jgi:hypothetical protein
MGLEGLADRRYYGVDAKAKGSNRLMNINNKAPVEVLYLQ